MKAPIHSEKHYRQITLSSATTLARNIEDLVTAVAGASTTPITVQEGALVKAIFVELWAIGSVSQQFFTVILVKLEGGFATPSFTNMTNLHDYQNKKNILYTTQGLASNDGIAAPIPLMRGWIKIPKGKQRMGLGDKITLVVASRGTADIDYCGFATYKEYT